jgi:hypothetical protein
MNLISTLAPGYYGVIINVMNKSIDNYINEQRSPQKEICQKLRKLIFKIIPGIAEEMRWGVPVYAGGKFYIGGLKDHVNLGFSIMGLSKKEMDLFEGKGKTMRHIKIAEFKDFDKEKIAKLLRLVNKKSKCDEVC